MVWHDLKRAIHTRHPKNIAELEQFCLEEWCKIPPDHWAGLIYNCRKLWFLRLCLCNDYRRLLSNCLLLHFRICCPKKTWVVGCFRCCSDDRFLFKRAFLGLNKLQSWPDFQSEVESLPRDGRGVRRTVNLLHSGCTQTKFFQRTVCHFQTTSEREPFLSYPFYISIRPQSQSFVHTRVIYSASSA